MLPHSLGSKGDFFPDLNPSEDEFRDYCVCPTVSLHQRARDELRAMDPEYANSRGASGRNKLHQSFLCVSGLFHLDSPRCSIAIFGRHSIISPLVDKRDTS
jgi:hypothetical protein